MAKASKKHFGAGSQGKGDGSGGMSGNAEIAENMVLSNRDKAALATGYSLFWCKFGVMTLFGLHPLGVLSPLVRVLRLIAI